MKFNCLKIDKYNCIYFCYNKIKTIVFIQNNIISILDFDNDLMAKHLNYEI